MEGKAPRYTVGSAFVSESLDASSTKMSLYYTEILISYLTENVICFHLKEKQVNVEYGLFLFIVKEAVDLSSGRLLMMMMMMMMTMTIKIVACNEPSGYITCEKFIDYLWTC